MTRTRALVAGATLAIASLSAASPQEQTQPTRFRSSAAAVMVDVTVRDRNRRNVTGLKAEDFTVLDNGVPQKVSDVSYGKLPIDVTVALDVSRSVTGAVLKQLQQAVLDLMDDLSKQDRLKLLLFNMKIVRTIDYTMDEKAVERAIREVRAGGGTALLDAIGVSLVSKSDSDRRQLVMFFTDGSDSSSTTAADTLIEVARRTRATVSFVMPGGIVSSPFFSTPLPGTPANTTIISRQTTLPPLYGLLSTVAAETGGVVLPIGQGGNVASSFRTVLNDFRSTYVLYYTPTGVERTGYHTIDVKVDKDGAKVQARRGYFGS
jgi:VWFA-related protein